MSIWDDPALQAPPEPAYIRLDNVGDGFDGRVVTVTRETFDDGSVAPQITFIDDLDGEQKFYTAGQTDAKRKLAELRPETADHISVRFVGTSGKFKHIEIKVNSRGGAQAPAANYAPQPGGTHTPAAVQQALPTHQPPPQVGQSYAPAAPPVYATNGGGNGGSAPAAPTGVDPAMWARMDDPQKALMLSVLGNTPAY